MKVINNTTGEIEELPADAAGSGFLSGQYNLLENEPVYLQSPSGGLDKYQPQDVFGAVKKSGYTFPTEQQIKAHENKQKYADQPLKAAALAAGDTATFGMLSRGLVGTGASTAETLSGIREENPIATGIGTVGGIVGSLAAAPEHALLKIAGEAVTAARASQVPSAILKAEAEYQKIRRTLVAADALNPVSAVTKLGDKAYDVLAHVPESATRAEKILKSTAGGFAQGALEGAAFTAGDINREHALGNPNITADQVFSDLGFSAVLGGGLNAIARGAMTSAKALKPGTFAEALRDSTTESASKMASSIDDTLKPLPSMIKPSSVEELKSAMKDFKVPENVAELPTRKRLIDITAQRPDLPPVLEPQLKSMESELDRVRYSNFKERGEGSADFLKWEAFQKQKAMESLNKTIDDLSGGKPIASQHDAANKIAQDFLSEYEATKKSLSPVFEQIKDVTTRSTVPPSDMIKMLEDSVPEASKFLKFDPENGIFSVSKYEPGSGLTKKVHSAIKDFASVINKEDSTVKNLWLFRQELDDLMYAEMAPAQKKMISDMRKMLLDVIEESVPDAKVRDTFKAYAINETKMDAMEQIFGGKIRPVIGKGKAFVPEKALGKIFSNTVNVDIARSALGQSKFNEAMGHYLSSFVEDNKRNLGGGFSSAQFFNKVLKNRPDVFNVAFKNSPDTLNRIYQDLDYMRFLPDKPSANPSGTAKSIFNMVKDAAADVGYTSPVAIVGKVLKDIGEQKVLTAEMNQMFREGVGSEVAKKAVEKHGIYSVLSAISDIKDKSEKKLSALSGLAVKGPSRDRVFAKASALTAMTAAEMRRKKDESRKSELKSFEKASRNIQQLISEPTAFMRSLDKMTSDLAMAAPESAAAIQTTAIRGIQFLSSKMPKNESDSLFPVAYRPSDYEISRFMKYKSTVDDPMSVLGSLKDNNVTVEQIETLNAVYPELYNAMRMQVMEKAVSLKSPPSYQKQLALSMFLGVDVDSSLSPHMIQANQASFATMKNGDSKQGSMQGIKPTSKGISNLNLSERSLLPMDKSANRKDSR